MITIYAAHISCDSRFLHYTLYVHLMYALNYICNY